VHAAHGGQEAHGVMITAGSAFPFPGRRRLMRG
jgi:hypothetical protein